MQFKAPAEDSKNYLRLKDKDVYKGIFRGDIYEFKNHWAPGAKTSEVCVPNCALCAAGLKGTFRFRLNFLVLDDKGTLTPKILEQGWTVYQQLRDLNNDYPLETTVVKISRSGSSLNDTSYSILPVPNGKVSPPMENAIKAIQLLELRHTPSQEQQVGDTFTKGPAVNFDEELPF